MNKLRELIAESRYASNDRTRMKIRDWCDSNAESIADLMDAAKSSIQACDYRYCATCDSMGFVLKKLEESE